MGREVHKGSVESTGVRHIVVAGNERRVIADLDEICLSVTCSGSANLMIRGRAETIILHVSGSWWVDAHAVESQSARVDASGSAVVLVRAEAQFEIHASGSARVQTFGAGEWVVRHREGSAQIARSLD
jgi:hypothetical protein